MPLLRVENEKELLEHYRISCFVVADVPMPANENAAWAAISHLVLIGRCAPLKEWTEILGYEIEGLPTEAEMRMECLHTQIMALADQGYVIKGNDG